MVVEESIFPKRAYMDTSIFISEFRKKDERHQVLTDFIKKVEKLKKPTLCYSRWALAETYNRLMKDEFLEADILRFIKNILETNKLRSLNIKPIGVYPNKNYSFDDFFNNLGVDLIKYKTGKDRPGLGDIIHIRIMKNNRIKTILTSDSHFEGIPGIIPINISNKK